MPVCLAIVHESADVTGERDVKRYMTNGAHVRELREQRERRATQKEFAHEVCISERHLRQIETRNAAVPVEVIQRIAGALAVPWQAVVFSPDSPRAVPDANAASSALNTAKERGPITMPRFDTYPASVVRDEADLFKSAAQSHVVVSHVLTTLTPETSNYADELLELLEALTWERRDLLVPVSGREELRIRCRLHELLVLLKGNDVWVYAMDHFKYFPESYDVPPKRDSSKMQMQAIIAFGPPGEYGEESLRVPIDHGQPWIYDPAARLF
jgi:transcriptional regulator with XRE-family HTH domain